MARVQFPAAELSLLSTMHTVPFTYRDATMCIGMQHGNPRTDHRAHTSNPRAQVQALEAECNHATQVYLATRWCVGVSQECNSGMAALHREAVQDQSTTECAHGINACLFQDMFKSVVV